MSCNWRPVLPFLITLICVCLSQCQSLADARHKYLDRMLLTASENGDLEEVRNLLARGADLNWRSKNHETPLTAAVEENQWTTASLLIAHGAHVNMRDRRGWTLLMTVIDRGHIDLITKLLAAGANPCIVEPHLGRSALYLAKLRLNDSRQYNPNTIQSSEAIVRMLIDHGAHETLHEAVWLKDASVASELLKTGTAADERDIPGTTALMYASQQADPSLLNLLLAHGADPNARDHNGKTPLMYSAAYRDFDDFPIPDILIQHGAKIDLQDKSGATALMYATQTWSRVVAKTLLSYHADARTRDKQGRTALTHAADWTIHQESTGIESYWHGVAPLLAYGVDVDARDNQGRTPLLIAASRWQGPETLQVLLKAGANPNAHDRRGATPLSWALERSNKEHVDLLRKAGAKIGLMEAIFMKDANAIHNALARGANVNIRGPYGLTPLMVAAQQGDITLCERLLTAGAEVNVHDDFGITPLLIAVGADGHGWRMRHFAYNHRQYFSGGPPVTPDTTDLPELAELLLSMGADIDVTDRDGVTPLQWAAVWGFGEDMNVLLAHGAGTRDRFGAAALADSVALRSDSMLRELLDYGADVNACDFDGAPMLTCAARNGTEDQVHDLVAHAADINRRDSSGQTALMVAIRERNAPIVRDLLAAGANRNLKDYDEKTALDYAKLANRQEISALLLQ